MDSREDASRVENPLVPAALGSKAVALPCGSGFEYRNLCRAELVEHAIRRSEGLLSEEGALAVDTGRFTGRSPQDKFIVRQGPLEDEISWGSVNQPMATEKFARLEADIIDHLGRCDHYRVDLSAIADLEYSLPVRFESESAWSALFALNLFLPPREQASQGEDGWTILHAPSFEAMPDRHGTASSTVVAIDFEGRRVLIAGTKYAGEIKKSIFTVLQGILPGHNIATMHCAANEGANRETALFFGLSGTGKTTLSTDKERRLIGDDEHGWSERGIFNFEGGCYAKTIGLSERSEPEIYRACRRFGTVLENVVLEPESRRPNFDDDSLTENCRAAYPLAFLDPAAGGTGSHPANVLFLTADAFGILPPLAKLTPDQALYWFLSGYTSKLAGTELGVTKPRTTFSACFGAPFLPLPPTRYATLFGEKLDRHHPNIWLVNTGWSGGAYRVGKRMPIELTRAVVAAALNGSLDQVAFDRDPVFGFSTPRLVPQVPSDVLQPRNAWPDDGSFDATAAHLAQDMIENFQQFTGLPITVSKAGPALPWNS